MRSHIPRASSASGRSAFTVLEFLVVATIIGVLAALIVPRFFGRVAGAKQSVAKQKIAVIEQKVVEFQVDTGRYPTQQEGLSALITPPPDVQKKWNGPYLKQKDILDPWDAEIIYRYPGQYNADFDVYTQGADHQEGGEDENADIGNW